MFDLLPHLLNGLVLGLLVTFAGSWVVMAYHQMLGGPAAEGTWLYDFTQTGLSPLRTWWELSLHYPEFQRKAASPEWVATVGAPCVAGIVVFAAMAGLLWLAACWRFGREEATGRS